MSGGVNLLTCLYIFILREGVIFFNVFLGSYFSLLFVGLNYFLTFIVDGGLSYSFHLYLGDLYFSLTEGIELFSHFFLFWGEYFCTL